MSYEVGTLDDVKYLTRLERLMIKYLTRLEWFEMFLIKYLISLRFEKVGFFVQTSV